jgi:(p)ppGpp synthase/HD superfamily hydrolase
MNKLQAKARELACSFHAIQMYGDYPYTKHLQDVVAVLERFGIYEDWILAAGWLHDSLEDTALAIETIKENLGDNVAALVFAVTTEPGINRHERNAKTYPKIKAQEMGVHLKLADRIANVESAIKENAKKLKMYRKEFPVFKESLKVQGVADEMWNCLEELLGECQ